MNNQPNQTTSVINNVIVGRQRRSLLVDLVMIFLTGGIWILWMLIRR